MASHQLPDPPALNDERHGFDLNLAHGHKDLVQAVAFNAYGDRCATGAVDGKIRVFNRHKDGVWRLCDNWNAHGGEIFELQWLPPTIYPNLLASLGIEGRFKLWMEDPSAPPGRRFSSSYRSSSGGPGKAAFETRSNKFPYRSFSLRHDEDSRHTYLALVASDGRLCVYENDQPENLSDFAQIDDFAVCPRPSRGEEVSFRVRFDPNPDPCYTTLRAGAAQDSLGMVVAAMSSVKIYRSRDVVGASYGVPQAQKEFYLAAEIGAHRSLVRDVAWAPGNVRGYDTIATACQDGFVRVFRVETPYDKADGKTWSTAQLAKREPAEPESSSHPAGSTNGPGQDKQYQPHHQQQHQSGLSASLAKSGASGDRHASGQPGQVVHTHGEVAKLDSHRTPVWRVEFDDDGQILGSTGDDGKLVFYRQTPQGTWARSSELSMLKTRMVAPT